MEEAAIMTNNYDKLFSRINRQLYRSVRLVVKVVSKPSRLKPASTVPVLKELGRYQKTRDRYAVKRDYQKIGEDIFRYLDAYEKNNGFRASLK